MEFINALTNRLSMQFIRDGRGDLENNFGPEDIFNYMYAIFHSPTYRERYVEFLKTDFPRLPLTSSPDLFRKLCVLGSRLVALHLMEQFGQITTTYPVPGDNVVERVEYSSEQGRVSINKNQYFANVAADIWEFYVGGYQVCQKWLKDRKDRALSYEDILHYQRIVAALAETITLMDEIDKVIDEHGGWPLQ